MASSELHWTKHIYKEIPRKQKGVYDTVFDLHPYPEEEKLTYYDQHHYDVFTTTPHKYIHFRIKPSEDSKMYKVYMLTHYNHMNEERLTNAFGGELSEEHSSIVSAVLRVTAIFEEWLTWHKKADKKYEAKQKEYKVGITVKKLAKEKGKKSD